MEELEFFKGAVILYRGEITCLNVMAMKDKVWH